jgi:hypothetical protein
VKLPNRTTFTLAQIIATVVLPSGLLFAQYGPYHPVRKQGTVIQGPIEGAQRVQPAKQSADVSNGAKPEQLAIAAQFANRITPQACAANGFKYNSDIRYPDPFSPGDTIYDAYCKLQTFNSSHKIELTLVGLPVGSPKGPILSSGFTPNGSLNPNADGQSLANSLALVMFRHQHEPIWSNVHTLGEHYALGNSPIRPYGMYQGDLIIQLGGIQYAGLEFGVTLTFAAEAGLVTEYLKDKENNPSLQPNFLELKLSLPITHYGRDTRPTYTYQDQVVAFPWVLYDVQYFSNDPKIALGAGHALQSSIVAKYSRSVKQNNLSTRLPQDNTNAMLTVINNGTIAISVAEEINGQTPYIKIKYSTAVQGPLDRFSPGLNNFNAYLKSVSAKQSADVVKATKTNPF